jgi:DNA topoisomerase-2
LDSGLQRIFRKILTGDKDKNMHLFDEGNKIVRNTRPESILTTFFTTRLGFYHKRKDHMLKIWGREQRMLSNKARFVEEVFNGDLIVTKRKKVEILSEFHSKGHELFLNDNEKKKQNNTADGSEEEANVSDQEEESGDKFQ